jgi:hypothetical protein
MGTLTIIGVAAISALPLFITVRTIYLNFRKIKKSEKITFIKGDHKITVSGNYNRTDSKKLMQL